MKRKTNELTKLYLLAIRTGLALWLDLGWCDCVQKQKGEIMSLDNVHIPIRANRTLSIAQINGKLEIAVLGMEDLFVTDSYFLNLYDAVKPFNDIHDLKNIIDQILDVEGML